MKVTHIITGLNRGGAEKALYTLLKNSKSNTFFEVISLTGRGVYSDKIESLGVKTYHIEVKPNNNIHFTKYPMYKLISFFGKSPF